MSDDITQANSDDSNGRCDPDKLGLLLAKVTQISDTQAELAGRRMELVKLLVELTGAAVGTWTWGVADLAATSVVPAASIDVGFTVAEKSAVIKMGLDPTLHEEMHVPVIKQMKIEGRSRDTSLRTDWFCDQTWKETQMFANLSVGAFDEWMHCVRYSESETWANLWLLRRTGSPPFEPDDRRLIDLAMANIPWLFATSDNTLTAESTVELTARQRMVLMMQLDGLSRKQIASRLDIGVETVGDHMKKIYEHFEVNSAGELAALFLRKR